MAISAMSRLGVLTVIKGCMFAGKTTKLMELAMRYSPAQIVTIKPAIDTRSMNTIKSHDGRQMRGYALDAELYDLSRLVRAHTRCVFADEVQFWDTRFADVVKKLNARGIDVVCAGLPLDFAERPFGCMPDLLAMADTIITLKARCNQCGEAATRTQRIIDGQPAKLDSPLILIGGSEQYEARCKSCYRLG